MRFYFFRLNIVFLATLAAAFLEYWTPAVFRNVFGGYAPREARVVIALLLLLSGFAWPKAHCLFPLSWRWSYVLLLPFLAATHNVSLLLSRGFAPIPIGLGIIFVSDGFAIAVIEEFLFRGLAFAHARTESPKRVVFVSTVGFAFCHLAALSTGSSLAEVMTVAITALPFGIIFGVIRLGTRGIVWPVIGHALIDISGNFSSGALRSHGTTPSLLPPLFLISSIMLFYLHPAMKSRAEITRVQS